MVTERSKGSKSHENKKLKDCASQRIRDVSPVNSMEFLLMKL